MVFNSRKYRSGEKRRVKRFALIPTRIDSNTIIWLEWYWNKEIYQIARNIGGYWFSYEKELVRKRKE